MNHNFNVNFAKEYGIEEAILIENLYFWCKKNLANEANIYEGVAWSYNSVSAFSELFPYMTEYKIANALKKLEKEGLLKVGNYNDNPYNRTKWYSVTEKAVSILGYQSLHYSKTKNGNSENKECTNAENQESLDSTDSKPFSKTTDSKPYIIIIDYLNEKAGTKFKVIQSVKGQIDERFKEGFTLDDFKTVIDKKVAEWKGTEYEKYLRPSTLFRPSKFDAYLNEKSSAKKHAGSKEAYSVDMSGYETL